MLIAKPQLLNTPSVIGYVRLLIPCDTLSVCENGLVWEIISAKRNQTCIQWLAHYQKSCVAGLAK